MNSLFKSTKEFIAAIRAVAVEAGVPSKTTCIVSDQDELYDGESLWQVRFNDGGPVVNIADFVDHHFDDDGEDESYFTATLLDNEKSNSAYSMVRSLPRSMLFDLREKLIPGYLNAVVETPDGFVWRVVTGDVVRELPVKLYETAIPSEQGDYEFALDTEVANAFFDVQPCEYENGGYIDYENAVDKSAERFAIRSFWWSGDSDSFGPLIRCVKFTLANGAVLHASYG